MKVLKIVRKYIIRDLTGLISKYYNQNTTYEIGKYGCFGEMNDYNLSCTMFDAICESGTHIEMFRYLLHKGIINAHEGFSNACRGGNMKMMRILSQRTKIDWDIALPSACESGNLNVVRFVIRNGMGELNDFDYTTALERASEGGYVDIFRVILPYVKRYSVRWGLFFACIGGNMEIVQHFLDMTSSPDELDEGLRGAFKGGHIDLAKHLIDQGATIHGTYYELEDAREGGNIELIRMILDNYSEDFIDHEQLIYDSCRYGRYDIANLLVQHGKNAHEYNVKKSYFLGACNNGNLCIVRKMANDMYIAELNDALQEACEGGHLEIVKFLILERKLTNLTGAMELACQEGNMDIVRFLISQGDKSWNEGLRGACREGYINIIKFMVEKGALKNKMVYPYSVHSYVRDYLESVGWDKE